MKNFFLSLFLLLGATSTSYAGGYLTSLSTGIVISEYLLHETGGMTVFTSGLSNPDSCTRVDRVHIDKDHSQIEVYRAAIITAAETGKKVGFYASHCATTHFWGGTQTVPIISNIWIRD